MSMPRLVITVENRSRVPLSRFYLLVREIIEFFGLEEVTCELED